MEALAVKAAAVEAAAVKVAANAADEYRTDAKKGSSCCFSAAVPSTPEYF